MRPPIGAALLHVPAQISPILATILAIVVQIGATVAKIAIRARHLAALMPHPGCVARPAILRRLAPVLAPIAKIAFDISPILMNVPQILAQIPTILMNIARVLPHIAVCGECTQRYGEHGIQNENEAQGRLITAFSSSLVCVGANAKRLRQKMKANHMPEKNTL